MKTFLKKIIPFLPTMLCVALILFLPDFAHATALASQVRSEMILKLWRVVLAIVNIAAILGLIFIAMVNILRINVETYNIRRMLPALVLAIILANFSHLICRLFIDFAQILTNFFIFQNSVFSKDVNGDTVARALGFGTDAMLGGGVQIGGTSGILGIIGGFILGSFGFGFLGFVIIGFVIISIPSILVLILALMCYVRLYIIWFLVILSPIAFFGLIFDPMKGLWSFWWGWFSKWLFLAPVGFFFLRLAVQVGDLSGSTIGAPTGGDMAPIGKFATWVFGLGMLFFAMYVPFSWGSNVFNALKGLALRGAALGFRAGNFTKKAAGARLMKNNTPGENEKPNTRYKFGQWLAKDYGKAWEGYQKEVEKASEIATYSGGMSEHIASFGDKGKYNPARINYIVAAQGKFQGMDNADAINDLAGGLDLAGADKYLALGGGDNVKKWAEANEARKKLITLAQGGNHRALEILQEHYQNVSATNLSQDDRRVYENVIRRLPETAHLHTEATWGARPPETAISNATRQINDNVEHHLTMNTAALANDETQIQDALARLGAGDIAGGKAVAKVLFRVMPEAEVEAMSTQELTEQLHQRMNSNQITSAMRTVNRPPQEIRERVRIRAFQDRTVEGIAADAGRLNIPGADHTARAAELAARLQGAPGHGTAEEQQAVRQVVIPHLERTLNEVPQYQLSDTAIEQQESRAGGALAGITNQAQRRRIIERVRTTRQAARNTAIEDIIASRAGEIAEVAENFRDHGQFDRLNDPNITNRNEIINQIDTHIP